MILNDIYNFVNELKRKYKTCNPYEIAEMCGVNVFYDNLGNVKGLFTIDRRNSFIILNENLSDEMADVVMFHELGHYFLHRKEAALSPFSENSLYNMRSKFEIEANTFAANYLISDEDITENAELGLTTMETAQVLCVPHDIVLIKIKDMNSRGYDLSVPYIPGSDMLA